jgi:serine/threonine protein kinase
VVRAFAVSITGSRSLVAFFPYYNQGSLGMVLRKQKYLELDEPLAKFFCAPTSFPQHINAVLGLLAGVRHIHSRGIVHNDLTPRNILVNFEAEKLALTVAIHDFGTASKLVENETHISFPTKEEEMEFWEENVYTADELIKGGRFTKRSDMYAVGLLIEDILGLRSRKLRERLSKGPEWKNVLALLNGLKSGYPSRRPHSAKAIRTFETLLKDYETFYGLRKKVGF